MDTKSKTLIAVFFALVVAASVWKYYVFVTKQDFIITNHISCNPSIESCFTYACDEEDEECDDNPFKKITKSAKNIVACNGDGCSELSCDPGETDCVISLCSEEVIEDGEVCIHNPPLEAATTSDPIDI